jgi:hypothetical protein
MQGALVQEQALRVERGESSPGGVRLNAGRSVVSVEEVDTMTWMIPKRGELAA